MAGVFIRCLRNSAEKLFPKREESRILRYESQAICEILSQFHDFTCRDSAVSFRCNKPFPKPFLGPDGVTDPCHLLGLVLI